MIIYQDKSFETWEDVVRQYPAMWVVFDRADFDGREVKAGHILVVLPDEDIIDYENKHFNEVKMSLRTTETVRITDENGSLVGYANGQGGYLHGYIMGDCTQKSEKDALFFRRACSIFPKRVHYSNGVLT